MNARTVKMREVACAISLVVAVLGTTTTSAQNAVDDDELGAWYMLFWNTKFGDTRFGAQGDAQYRNWNLGGDLEQLLLRGGLTYSPERLPILLTLGYGYIESGEFDSDNITSVESRVYQELLWPHRVGKRLHLAHRFRNEQRWVEDQDFRTRFRYALFVNIPINRTAIEPGSLYVALYNEIFVNLENDIGSGRQVDHFDRNRSYGGLGYTLTDKSRVQFGFMHQLTNSFGKNQLQFSLHQRF